MAGRSAPRPKAKSGGQRSQAAHSKTDARSYRRVKETQKHNKGPAVP